MNDRFKLLWDANVRNAKEYNIRFRQRKLNPSKGHHFLPYIVVIIDKYYDIAMCVEEVYLTKLVRKAHAAGIHIILSVQRPSQDILSNNTKSYFPVRIAFRTASRQESMIILDEEGAERLSGNGDAIYKDELYKIRLQAPYISTSEIKKITQYISRQQGYDHAYNLPGNVPLSVYSLADLNDRDPLFDEAARLIVVHQQGSPSLIQRKFSIGYNRAGRLMDQLETAGIVGPVEGSKPREVFIADEYSLEKLLSSLQ
ncbi:MAG: DNA translocase FtsK [Proteiniphilum sp.]